MVHDGPWFIYRHDAVDNVAGLVRQPDKSLHGNSLARNNSYKDLVYKTGCQLLGCVCGSDVVVALDYQVLYLPSSIAGLSHSS